MAPRIVILAAALLAVAPSARMSMMQVHSAQKPVLGATASITESESGLVFAARVDTGATSCSIHAESVEVAGGSAQMEENVGKTVRFRITNRNGNSAWLERPIANVSLIKNSGCAEWRYKVPLTLLCNGKEKQVLVSLDDRSQMHYPMLVGRNLLAGEFIVDVGADD